jgi:hypothetical protein
VGDVSHLRVLPKDFKFSHMRVVTSYACIIVLCPRPVKVLRSLRTWRFCPARIEWKA